MSLGKLFETLGNEYELTVQAKDVKRSFSQDANGIEEFLRVICGIRLSWKMRSFVRMVADKVAAREIIRCCVVAGRGTGKTFLVSALEHATAHIFGWQWCNLGGSLGQATKAYEYIQSWVNHPLTVDNKKTSIQTRTVLKNGAKIHVLSASTRSTRSPHVGNKTTGGGLVLDEEAEMEPKIVKSSIPIVDTANPSAIIRASTPHKETGTFRELIQNPGKSKYEVFRWDIFDAMETCTVHCASCPVKEFAQDTYREDKKGTLQLEHKAFCAGRAHFSQGHIRMDEVVQHWHESDLYTWMTEYMGLISSSEGFVYDPRLLDQATINADVRVPDQVLKDCKKAIGIDWGFEGQTAIVSLVQGPEQHIFVYDWMLYTKELGPRIQNAIVDKVMRERITRVYADREDAFQNAELKQRLAARGADCVLVPVNFNKMKRFGITNIRGMLEKKKLHFWMRINGQQVRNAQEALLQLKNYEMGPNGKPKKVNDHCPDALLSAALCFAAVSIDPVPSMAVYEEPGYVAQH